MRQARSSSLRFENLLALGCGSVLLKTALYPPNGVISSICSDGNINNHDPKLLFSRVSRFIDNFYNVG